MSFSLMQNMLLEIKEREDLKLSTPRNSRVLSGVDALLRTLKENPEEDPKVRAVIQFLVSLFEELQIIVARNVQSGNKRSKELYGPHRMGATSRAVAGEF